MKVLITNVICFLIGVSVYASEPLTPQQRKVNCATLKAFQGDVQILDAGRQNLIDTDVNQSIPCGGWISVRKGSAILHHRQGFDLKLSPQTFIEIFDNEKNVHKTSDDHVIVYKGKVYVVSKGHSGEVRLLSPNARMRIETGEGIFLYSQWNEESQLLMLKNTATIENRYAGDVKIKVSPGEASSLNFKNMRVVPSDPKAVQVSSIKDQLLDLPLDFEEMETALNVVKKRSQRKFAAKLYERKKGKRFSWAAQKKGPKDFTMKYGRQRVIKKDRYAENLLIQRLTGGRKDGKEYIYPSVEHGSKKTKISRLPASVKVKDPLERIKRKDQIEESEEKKRLMKELSAIKFER